MKKKMNFVNVNTALLAGALVVSPVAIADSTVSDNEAIIAGSTVSDNKNAPAIKEKISSGPSNVGDLPQNEIQGAAGYRVYKDPVTGKFGPAPATSPPLDLSIEIQDAISTSPVGLEEINTGNGVMVNLMGRFQNALIFTIGDKGKVPVSSSTESSTDKTE